MHAHAHADRPSRKRSLRLTRRSDRRCSDRKHVEERVPLGPDLHPTAPVEHIPHHPPVLDKRPLIHLRAQLPQQTGRAFDVREDQGDDAGRKLAIHEP